MLSEKQDANFITYWHNEWKRSGAKIPYEVVTDISKALQNAISMSFNLKTFRDYNISCLLILQNRKKNIKHLICWIRTDIAHLMNAVSRWTYCPKSRDTKEEENKHIQTEVQDDDKKYNFE